MSFPLGVIAYPAANAGVSHDSDLVWPTPLAKFLDRHISLLTPKRSPQNSCSPPSSASSSRWKRARQRPHRRLASPVPTRSAPSQHSGDSPNSLSPHCTTYSPNRLDSRNRCGAKVTTKSKYIPIRDHASVVQTHPAEDLVWSHSNPTLLSPYSDFESSSAFHHSNLSSGICLRPRRTHIEIQIPKWAHPILKDSINPPRVKLSKSVFLDPFEGLANLCVDSTNSYPTMESIKDSEAQIHPSRSPRDSNVQAISANSSQSSLIGRRDEYDSSSDAEFTKTNESSSQTQSRLTEHNLTDDKSTAPQAAPINNPHTSLSGLVCNVHRTTGNEPRSLVGATTTILGDMLYVFGGRRLSQTKPHLTSDLFELDLIRRHWTKLDAQGDIPAPRYFHSICTLGDTKLVCYGGMSPADSASPATQAEVIVMSDIHVYDVPTRRWTKIDTADPPQGRYAHCAAILPSSAVFTSANAPMSAISHNPSGKSNPNHGTLGVSLDGAGGAEMVVVGGQDSANHYIEQVSVFNLRSLKWTGTMSMGRSCGAYRSVVCPLTTMNASEIGAGPHTHQVDPDDDEDSKPLGAGAPMLVYSNYNFLDVKLELQVRLTDGTLIEKPMQTGVCPPGLRFPNGGVIDNHFVVSGTFLTSSKQEYALWALDLRTLAWSRIDAGGSIFSQGSWNRGVLWNRGNAFVILGNRKRSLVDDYNNRRINFSNVCFVELEAFGLYENPRRTSPSSGYISASAATVKTNMTACAEGRQLHRGAEDLGTIALGVRELSDMDFLAIDGTRIPVNSRLIARRWGHEFNTLIKESSTSIIEDTATLRPTTTGHPARNSSITITPSATSGEVLSADVPDNRSAPPVARSRLFYLPHTAQTLQALLHYLYTSNLPPVPSPLATPQVLCSLLQLSRPYHIDGLLEAVVERLHESLDGRNAAAIFNAAAMGAGGGSGVRFVGVETNSSKTGNIPPRTVSLIGIDSLTADTSNRINGVNASDFDASNIRRAARNTLRPGEAMNYGAENEDGNSTNAEDSMSESESNLASQRLPMKKDRLPWNGSMSPVVGLQKRGLRGLMEGRRLRERGRPADTTDSGRVGLGIA